jgi:hypothetical protein
VRAGVLGAALLASALVSRGDPGAAPANPALERWFGSVGGRPALSAVRSVEVTEATEEGGGPGSLEERTLVLEPGMIRVDITLPGASTLVLSSDGRNGWREVRDLGFGLMQPNEVNTLLLVRDPMSMGRMGGPSVTSEPAAPEVRGATRYDVYLLRVHGKLQERWFFDQATGLLARVEGGEKPHDFTSEFSDYRPVGSLRLPFEFGLRIGGRTAFAVHRRTIALNVQLTPSFFSAMAWDLGDAARAQAILDRYQAVCTDPRVAAAQRTRVIRETVDTPATGVVSHRTITLVYPDKILVDTETKGLGRTLMGYDGSTGWTYSEILGAHALKPAQIPMVYSSLSTLGYPSMGSEAPLRRIIGPKVVSGRKATALLLSGLREPIGTFYFDDENGWLLRYSSTKRSSGTTRPVKTIDFSDYRTVNGRALPFEVVETTLSLQAITRVEAVDEGKPVDEAIFRPRTDD